MHAFQLVYFSLAHPSGQRLLPVPLHAAPVNWVNVPGGPLHHCLSLSLAMNDVVLVALVPGLAPLEFMMHGLPSLLTHHRQPLPQPV